VAIEPEDPRYRGGDLGRSSFLVKADERGRRSERRKPSGGLLKGGSDTSITEGAVDMVRIEYVTFSVPVSKFRYRDLFESWRISSERIPHTGELVYAARGWLPSGLLVVHRGPEEPITTIMVTGQITRLVPQADRPGLAVTEALSVVTDMVLPELRQFATVVHAADLRFSRVDTVTDLDWSEEAKAQLRQALIRAREEGRTIKRLNPSAGRPTALHLGDRDGAECIRVLSDRKASEVAGEHTARPTAWVEAQHMYESLSKHRLRTLYAWKRSPHAFERMHLRHLERFGFPLSILAEGRVHPPTGRNRPSEIATAQPAEEQSTAVQSGSTKTDNSLSSGRLSAEGRGDRTQRCPNRPIKKPVARGYSGIIDRSHNVEVYAPRHVRCLACGTIWKAKKAGIDSPGWWRCPKECNLDTPSNALQVNQVDGGIVGSRIMTHRSSSCAASSGSKGRIVRG
jgi:hypothetical protein